MSALNGDEPSEREIYLCSHWILHRLAARELTGFAESSLPEDEWVGHPPPEALTAIAQGEPDLTLWCPVLNAGLRETHFAV